MPFNKSMVYKLIPSSVVAFLILIVLVTVSSQQPQPTQAPADVLATSLAKIHLRAADAEHRGRAIYWVGKATQFNDCTDFHYYIRRSAFWPGIDDVVVFTDAPEELNLKRSDQFGMAQIHSTDKRLSDGGISVLAVDLLEQSGSPQLRGAKWIPITSATNSADSLIDSLREWTSQMERD